MDIFITAYLRPTLFWNIDVIQIARLRSMLVRCVLSSPYTLMIPCQKITHLELPFSAFLFPLSTKFQFISHSRYSYISMYDVCTVQCTYVWTFTQANRYVNIPMYVLCRYVGKIQWYIFKLFQISSKLSWRSYEECIDII